MGGPRIVPQVVSPLGDVLSLPIETELPMLHSVIHVADPLFLSLDSFLELHCLRGLRDFHFAWLLNIFAVPALLAAVVGMKYTYDKRNGHDAKERARTLGFVLCFLMYVSALLLLSITLEILTEIDQSTYCVLL